jgi:hypothetical protein
MTNYVIGLNEADWRAHIEARTECRQWQFISALRNYRPTQGDCLIGFFSLAELSLLQRFGVDVWTLMRDGLPMPGVLVAWQHRRQLELGRVALSTRQFQAHAGFSTGPGALLKAAAQRHRQEQAGMVWPLEHGGP